MGILGTACGGGSSTSVGTSVGSSTASTMPSDLVLSSPTASASSTSQSSLSLTAKTKRLAGDFENNDYQSKKEALENLILGEDDCAFTVTIEEPARPNCYGPAIDYTNHPGGGSGQLPSGDTGIWDEFEGGDPTGEACAAAQMNYLIDIVASRVDNMIKILGSMSCAGKKEDVELPAIGAEVNLKTAMEDNLTLAGSSLTITTATLERLADTADNKAQYRSNLDVTFDLGGGSTASGTMILTHIPLDEDNETYKGKLSMSYSVGESSQETGFNCFNLGATGVTYAATFLYNKSSASNIVYEMNYATYCGEGVDPFDADGNLDPADKAAEGDFIGKWGDTWHYGLFNLDPVDGTGSVQYAWQAGAGDGATRVLNVTVASATDGSASGDAYFGFGPDVESSELGTIDGMICNWAGPAQTGGVGHANPLPYVQYQGLTRAANATVYSSDASTLAIGYAITNDCTVPTSANFDYENAGPDDMTNDHQGSDPDPFDLADLSTYTSDFTAITPPEDI